MPFMKPSLSNSLEAWVLSRSQRTPERKEPFCITGALDEDAAAYEPVVLVDAPSAEQAILAEAVEIEPVAEMLPIDPEAWMDEIVPPLTFGQRDLVREYISRGFGRDESVDFVLGRGWERFPKPRLDF